MPRPPITVYRINAMGLLHTPEVKVVRGIRGEKMLVEIRFGGRLIQLTTDSDQRVLVGFKLEADRRMLAWAGTEFCLADTDGHRTIDLRDPIVDAYFLDADRVAVVCETTIQLLDARAVSLDRVLLDDLVISVRQQGDCLTIRDSDGGCFGVRIHGQSLRRVPAANLPEVQPPK